MQLPLINIRLKEKQLKDKYAEIKLREEEIRRKEKELKAMEEQLQSADRVVYSSLMTRVDSLRGWSYQSEESHGSRANVFRLS